MADPTPQDEVDYVLCRMYLETGALAYAKYKETGTWPETDPPTSHLIDTLLQFITPDVIPLTAEEAAILAKAGNKQLPPELRRGDIIFRNRAALVEGLNTMAPATADAIKKKAPGADDGGIEWWAVALTAGGVLAMLGKLNWQGALLSIIASRLMFGAAIYMGLTAKTEDGQNVIKAGFEAAKEAAADTFSWVKWVVGGVVAVGAGLVIYKVVSASTPARKQLPARRDEDYFPRRSLRIVNTTADDVDEEDLL